MRPHFGGKEQKAKSKTVRLSVLAIYHLHAQVIKRSEGRSAVAAAAYRCGARFTDARTGLNHDFTKKGGVDFVDSFAPADAPDWAFNPARLWNAAEASEKRKDAQVARELDIAIPRELTTAQKRAVVVAFVKRNFIEAGMVATVAWHHLDGTNPHAHIMLTTRTIGPDGFGQKCRDWNSVERLEAWREDWARCANSALKLAGHDDRIDHRSHAARGLSAIEPTTHQGPTAAAMTRRKDWPNRVRPMVVDALLGAYEYAREAVVGFASRLESRRSPLDVRPPPMPRMPVPPWMKPPRH